MRPRRDLLAAAGAVFRHLAAELVAEHDALARAHEVVVADLGQHLGQLVAVVARVKVRSADPAPQHPEQDLPFAGAIGAQVSQLELCLSAGDGFHVLTNKFRATS